MTRGEAGASGRAAVGDELEVRYDWNRLNKRQLARLAEYVTMIQFTVRGFQIDPAADGRPGVDFVARRGRRRSDVVVRSGRLKLVGGRDSWVGTTYPFVRKDQFSPRPDLLAAFVLCRHGQPADTFLFSSLDWKAVPRHESPSLLVDRDYEGRQSPPEYGLYLSQATRRQLDEHAFSQVISAYV